jgi:tetratricopeptide (TPR) repeat protein
MKTSPVYQFANNDDDAVVKNFIVRQVEFQTIISRLKDKSNKDSLQHELILGRRGSGKSTLLKRIEVEIRKTPALEKKYIPVNPAEEQAGIYRLFDLWEQVLNELSSYLKQEINVKDFFEFSSEQEYARYLYEIIHQISTTHKKKIVLLLDNFDRIVENFTDDGHLLREILINYNDVALITASTRMDEHFWRYDKPFYEFFRKHRLETLSKKETIELLESWSVSLNVPQIKKFIEKYPGKVENIRLLTDGLPRTMRFFMEIILHNEKTVDVDFLKKIMDEATPQYQERLNYLTPQLRKIVLEMAFLWEACSTKQLVEKCKMESKLISANLKILADKGIIDTISTNKRNNLYRISERFFNMWLIVTQGNPEQKRKVRWLSVFLENWYNANELQELAKTHIDNLKQKKLKGEEALLLSKGFCQSRFIPTAVRDQIIELTKQQIDLNEDQIVGLPESIAQIINKIDDCIHSKNFKKSHELIDSIENESDGFKEFAKGYIYGMQEKYKEVEKYYLLAIKKGENEALNNLASLYADQEKYKEAEKYYLLAIEKGNNKALFNLASLYKDQEKYKEAEKYYLLAIEEGDNKALNNLALLYRKQEKHKEAEKYYLLAIEKDVHEALNNLASLYADQEKYKEAEKYYLLAIKEGVHEALWNLTSMYYLNNQHKEKAGEYIQKINEEHPFLLLEEIWCGIFNDVENRIFAALRKEDGGYQAEFITRLLVHNQNTLVYKAFTNPEFGQKLQDKYKVLYYACLILNYKHKEESNLLLKIPPELETPLNDVLETIASLKEFYRK